MRSLLRTSTLLVGAILFTFAQADSYGHLHAHDVRNVADLLAMLEGGNGAGNEQRRNWNGAGSAAKDEQGQYSNEGVNGKKNEQGEAGNEGGKGAKNYHGGNDKNGQATKTIEVVIETGKGKKGKGTVAAAEEQKTTITWTKTISEVVAAGTSLNGDGQQSGQAAVQLSFVTTTVLASGEAQTVTATPLAQIITQYVTVTAPGTCSTNGLTGGTTYALQPPAETTTSLNPTIASNGVGAAQVSSTESPALSSAASSSTEPTNAVSAASQVPTSILVAPSASLVWASVPSSASGQVVQGTGTTNSAGQCNCACICAAGSFPLISGSAAATIPPAVPTTMQTVASPAAAQSLESASVTDTISSAGTTDSLISTPSSSAAASTSEISTTSGASATSEMSSTSSETPTLVSAQPDLASSSDSPNLASLTVTTATQPTSAQGPAFPLDISTLSLSSKLVLGNLAAQATPNVDVKISMWL